VDNESSTQTLYCIIACIFVVAAVADRCVIAVDVLGVALDGAVVDVVAVVAVVVVVAVAAAGVEAFVEL